MVLNSIVDSIKDVYIMIIAAGALTVICSWDLQPEVALTATKRKNDNLTIH
jgi:hypothetical protein